MKVLSCLIVLVLIFSGCDNKGYDRDFPSVSTSDEVIVEDDGVTVQGYFEGGGTSKIVDLGFVYYLSNSDGLHPEKVSLGAASAASNDFRTKILRNLIIGETYSFKAFVITDNFTVYGDEQSFVSKGGIAPELKSYGPTNAWIGDTITIAGLYFSDRNENNTIYFGSELTHPVFSNDSLMKVIVPNTIKTARNTIRIEVAGKSSFFSEEFQISLPVVDEIYPDEILPGEHLKIKGRGLCSIKSIVIGQNTLPVYSVNDTAAVFSLPNDVPKGTMLLKLMMFENQIDIDKTFKIVLPEIVSVSPQVAWIDSILTIKGKHLGKLTNFQIGGIHLQEVSKNDSVAKLRVTNVFNSATINARFLYTGDIESGIKVELNMPVITSIFPSEAHAGEAITIKGERFFYGMSPSIGNFQSITENEAVLILPWNLSAGSHVINLEYGFDFSQGIVPFTVPEIKILDYYPKDIIRGETVTVEVENMPENLSGYYSVAFDNKPGNFIGKSGNKLQVTVPNNTDISGTPSLSVFLAGQVDEIPNAFNLKEYWISIDKNFSMNGADYIFVENKEEHYMLSQDQLKFSLLKFNNISEQWVQIDQTDLLTYSGIRAAFSVNNELYFITNKDESSLNYKYSVLTKEWTKIANFQWSNNNVGALYSFVIDDIAYVGSIDGFWRYDAQEDKWINMATLPITHYEFHDVLNFAYLDEGYVAFSKSIVDDVEMNEFWKYNAGTDSWTNIGGAPLNIHGGGSAVINNAQAYILGKAYSVGNDEFISYDPVSQKSQRLLSPPGYWANDFYLFHENGYIYFISREGTYSGWSMKKIPSSRLQEIVNN